MRKDKKLKITIMYIVLGIICLFSVYPFIWLIISSTLSDTDIFKLPPKLFFGNNFFKNFENLNINQPIWKAFKNSMFISVTYTILTLYLSSLAGYTFAKFDFKFKNILLGIVLMTMMLPVQITLIPLFKISIALGWQNKAAAIVIPALANTFGVFFMKQNMTSIPTELLESARIDGASEFSIFHKIILPTSLPPLAALGILSFIQQWGNFLWPLIILQDKESTTLPVLLSMMVQRGQVVHYGEVLVGTMFSILPVLVIFLLLQKYFIAGIYSGSVKG